MNLRSVLWSRLTWIFSSFTLFILYLTEYRNYHVKYAYLADRYSKLLVHSGGLSAQLQLMMERNHRAEKMLTDMRNRHSQIIKEIDKKQHGNELLWSLCKNALYKCFIGVLKGSEQKKRKKILISYKDVKYRNCIVECQMQIQKHKNRNDGLATAIQNASVIRTGFENLNLELSSTGDHKYKTNYIQNGKVQFKRLNRLNEELEFHRNRSPALLSNNTTKVSDIEEQYYKDYKDAR